MLRSATLILIAAGLCAGEPATAAAITATPLALGQAIELSAVVAGVKLADLTRAAAEQGVRVERSGLLPQVNAVGTATRGTSAAYPLGYDQEPTSAGPYTSLDGRIKVGQALLDLSSWYRTDAAKADVRAATSSQRQALEDAALGAAVQYVSLARTQALVSARKVDLSLAEELAALAEAQVKAGVAEPINATRSQTQVSVARGDMLVAENRESQAHIDLARALDLELAQRFQMVTPFDGTICASTAPVAAGEAVKLALSQRPEIQASLASIEAEQHRLAAIKGERWGSAQVYGEAGRTGPEFDATTGTWTVGLQYSVPLFDGLRREGRIESQDIAARRARVQLGDLKQKVAADARAAAIVLDSGERYWVVAKERVALAEKELAQARDRFRVGVASNLDVIAAQQSVSSAMDAEIQARATVATARARLARAVGIATTLR